MTTRTAFIGAAALVLSASSVSAQGKPPKQIVISEAVMKSMAANKPKSKTPLTARLGMIRQARSVTPKPAHGTPTSVREIRPASKKK